MCRFLKQNAWFWVFFILLLLHTIFRLLGCFFLGTKGSCKIDYFLWSIWTRKIQVCTFPIFNLSLDCHKKYSIALNEFIFLGNEWWKTLSFLLNFRHFLHYPGKADHLTCLLRNLYAGQEATVRTSHGTTDWFQIGKGVLKAVYCYPAYLIYMQSTSCEMLGWMKHKLESRLPDEAQAGIKIARRNINYLRYANDTILMVESEELKSLLMKVKEEREKIGLKSTFRKLRSWHLVPSLHGK